jgi:glycosyltransferase involved in cell wall biosynthesis
MNILYDVTPMAATVRSPGERTGIYRVAHEVAVGLAAAPDCRLTFCTPGFPRLHDDAVALTATDPAFAGVRVARPPVLAGRAHRALRRAGDGFPTAPARTRVGRVVQQAAFRGMRLVESAAAPFAAADLAGADLFHSTFHPLPRGTGRLPRVLTVYDVIAVRRPDLFDPYMPRHVRRILRSLAPDDWVVCISEATRRDLLDVRPDLDPGRVRVTPLAAGPRFRRPPADGPGSAAAVAARHGLPPGGRYVLALNTLEPRKNTDGVVRAFAALAEEPGMRDVRLVLAGGRGWKVGPLMGLIESLPAGVRGRVAFTGFVPDADLPGLYAGAAAFAYPSHYEGFGLPPLEAMACGAAVVTSDNSSLPEVVGDAGLTVPSADPAALADALRRVLTDEGLRAELSRRAVARAATFSWERCAADTVAAYRVALAEG